MTFEEIIDHLDELEKFDVENEENRQALREAIALLRTHPDNHPNDPLTVEELRTMDCQPVVVAKGNDDPMWALLTVTPHNAEFVEFSVYCADGDKLCFDTDGDNNFDGEEVVFYRRPPKEA